VTEPDAAPPAVPPAGPPAAPAPSPPAAPVAGPPGTVVGTPRRPSLVRRAIVAVLLLVPSILFFAIVPAGLLGITAGFGLESGVGAASIALGGILLAALWAAQYVVRPTVAFGPVSVVASTVALAYLWWLVPQAHIAVAFMSNGSASLSYGTVIELLMLVPAFGLASGAVSLVEDVVRPGERVAQEFPP